MTGTELPEIAAAALMARVLLLSTERIRQMAAEGVLPKTEKYGQYPFEETIQAYIRFLRQSALSARGGGKADRIKDARAREIELRIAEKEKQVIPVDEHIATIDRIVGELRNELDGFAAMTTRDRAMRGLIEEGLHGVLNRAAAKISAEADRLEARRPAAHVGRAHDAGPVGESE